MQHLKINWQFDWLVPGYLFLLACYAVGLSLALFLAHNWQQYLLALLGIAYLGSLLLFKFKSFLPVIIVTLFLVFSWYHHKQAYVPNLATIRQVKIYADQIKIKDHWLSGVGNTPQGQVLLGGKVTPAVSTQFQLGKSVLLTQLAGEVESIMPASNRGQFDTKRYYATKGIGAKLTLTHFKATLLPLTWDDFWHQLRAHLQNFCQHLPGHLGFFTSELLLGESSGDDGNQLLTHYRQLGVIHLLSISGQHVAIYVLVLTTFCYWIKLTDDEALLICAVFLLISTYLADFQPGFVRAGLTFLLSRLAQRAHLLLAPIDCLGLACLLQLAWQPQLFVNLGAQLSYLAALGLQLTAKRQGLSKAVLLNSLLTPLLLQHFAQVNLLTVFFNLLVVPYFNYVVMPMVYLNLVMSFWGSQFSGGCEWLLAQIESGLSHLATTGLGQLTFGQISWWQCLVLLVGTLISLGALTDTEHLPVKVISFLLVCYGCFFMSIHFPWQGQVTFIDIGQGDSILITTPFRRHVYLIDTGGQLNFSGRKIQPQIERITLPFLRSQGITKIDAIFVSHQDADHVGDLGPLLTQMPVKRLYVARGILANQAFRRRVKKARIKTQIIQVLAGTKIKEAIEFQVRYPFKEGLGTNDDSLAVTFQVGGARWLFTGDLPQAGELELMSHQPFKATYFKLGNHGSRTASHPDFLKQLAPKQVFISAGRKNHYGHPQPETLATLKKLRIPWVSTKDCGMISWYYGGLKGPHFSYFLKERLK
ncbi:MAG: DNA internalization-related competence protein ComEC/Rec2 [Lactobacillus sp.]